LSLSITTLRIVEPELKREENPQLKIKYESNTVNLERLPSDQTVVGSNPAGGARCGGINLFYPHI